MSSSPVLVLDIDGVVSLAQPAGRGTPSCRRPAGFGTRRWARLLPQATRARCCGAGSTSTSRCTNTSRPRAWPTGWRSSSPTGSRRTRSSTAKVLAMADAWRHRTGGRVFAASNQEHHRAAYLRDQPGLGAHFDEIIYSAALGVCKPDRVFFTNAQARMGVTRGAGDPVRRRQRRQCRRRAHGRLARGALSRAREPGAGPGGWG